MNKCLYSVRDARMGTFAPPCLFDNDNVAIRAFGDMVRGDKQSLIALHPEDFTLVYLGAFNVETGVVEQSADTIRVLAVASDFVKAGKE